MRTSSGCYTMLHSRLVADAIALPPIYPEVCTFPATSVFVQQLQNSYTQWEKGSGSGIWRE